MTREDVIKEMINTWLMFPALTCGWCGKAYEEGVICCEKPFIANNKQIFDQFLLQIREDRETRENIYASTADKSIRWTLSFPPGLIEFLIRGFEKHFGEKLFNEKYPQSWFAKRFDKMFAIPERI